MPATIPLPLPSPPEGYPTSEATAAIEAEIKVMYTQIQDIRNSRRKASAVAREKQLATQRARGFQRPSKPESPVRLRPRSDFAVHILEHEEGTLLRDTLGRVRSIKWTEYSASVSMGSEDRSVVDGPKRSSRRDAAAALLEVCSDVMGQVVKLEEESIGKAEEKMEVGLKKRQWTETEEQEWLVKLDSLQDDEE